MAVNMDIQDNDLGIESAWVETHYHELDQVRTEIRNLETAISNMNSRMILIENTVNHLIEKLDKHK